MLYSVKINFKEANNIKVKNGEKESHVGTPEVHLSEQIDNHFLLYLSSKRTMYVNNYLFLITLLHVSMFTHHPQGVLKFTLKLIINEKLYRFVVTQFIDYRL